MATHDNNLINKTRAPGERWAAAVCELLPPPEGRLSLPNNKNATWKAEGNSKNRKKKQKTASETLKEDQKRRQRRPLFASSGMSYTTQQQTHDPRWSLERWTTTTHPLRLLSSFALCCNLYFYDCITKGARAHVNIHKPNNISVITYLCVCRKYTHIT